MEDETKVRTQMCLKMTKEQERLIQDKAAELGMNKTQYVLQCVENQPAIPEFVWESDDLSEIIDTLSDVREHIQSLSGGITMIGSVTQKDIDKLTAMNQEMNRQYLSLVEKYTTQRKQVTKTARRLVREWKKSEKATQNKTLNRNTER